MAYATVLSIALCSRLATGSSARGTIEEHPYDLYSSRSCFEVADDIGFER